ncbi:hypothetical protein GGS21DRAFT_34606 [Xylaria nigripes]|nr:hypothetical protein GGS21DRAFT_34606 [Xylaria nigripes]
MPHATYSSTPTQTSTNDYIPSTISSRLTQSYPRELNISTTRTSTAPADNAGRPLMGYSLPFTSTWQRDFTSGANGQSQWRLTWSLQPDDGSHADGHTASKHRPS